MKFVRDVTIAWTDADKNNTKLIGYRIALTPDGTSESAIEKSAIRVETVYKGSTTPVDHIMKEVLLDVGSVYEAWVQTIWIGGVSTWKINTVDYTPTALGTEKLMTNDDVFDSEGKFKSASMPALAISEVYTVADVAALYALGEVFQKGDLVVIEDVQTTYINTTGENGNGDIATNFSELKSFDQSAVDARITEVRPDGSYLNSNTTKSDVGLSNVPNTDFTTPVGNNTTHRGLVTGNPHAVSKSDVGLGSVLNQAQTSTFKQAAIPISLAIGDVWYDTDDNNKVYVAASVGATTIATGYWEAVTPNKTTIGLGSVLNVVQPRTFSQTGIPTSTAVGDYWIDTDDDNLLYVARCVNATTVATGAWEVLKEYDNPARHTVTMPSAVTVS